MKRNFKMSLEVKIEELTKAILELNLNIAKIGTVTGVEAPKKVNEGVSLPKDEKVAEEPEKAPAKKRATKAKVTVTLEELKDLAAKRAKVSGRDKTRAIIGEYGEKLSEVKPEDYEALAEKLGL